MFETDAMVTLVRGLFPSLSSRLPSPCLTEKSLFTRTISLRPSLLPVSIDAGGASWTRQTAGNPPPEWIQVEAQLQFCKTR